MVTEQDTAPRSAHDKREELRRSIVEAHVPANYSPTVHMLIPSVLGLAVMIAAVALLRDLRWTDLLTIPITLLAAFGFEWRAHKDVLHHRRPGLGVLYERHELAHHVLYTYDDLAMRSRRELFLILMPPYAVVLVFLTAIPIAGAVYLFSGLNAALLTTATSMAFFLSYEWMHFSYHQPPESFIGRLSVVRVLRELHRRHHDPRLMKRWNFNVTVPVFDWVHRTMWSPEREAARDSSSRGRVGMTARRVSSP